MAFDFDTGFAFVAVFVVFGLGAAFGLVSAAVALAGLALVFDTGFDAGFFATPVTAYFEVIKLAMRNEQGFPTFFAAPFRAVVVFLPASDGFFVADAFLVVAVAAFLTTFFAAAATGFFVVVVALAGLVDLVVAVVVFGLATAFVVVGFFATAFVVVVLGFVAAGLAAAGFLTTGLVFWRGVSDGIGIARVSFTSLIASALA